MRFLIVLILICCSTRLQASPTLYSNENEDGNRIVEIKAADRLPDPTPATKESASTFAPVFWYFKNYCFGNLVIVPSYLQLYTYWTKGVPEDVSVQLYVLGTDPAFRFNRLCDETPNVHIFTHNAHNTKTQQTQKLEDQLETVLELRGNCFNATLLVRKHTVRCPWCPVEVSSGLAQSSAQYTGEFNSSDQEPGRTKILIGFLAAITLINTVAFVGLLLMCLLKCKKGKRLQTPPNQSTTLPEVPIQSTPVSHCTLISSMPAIHEEDYEIIRDESFSPLPSLHPYLRPKTTKRNTNRVAVQLPTSRRCDRCFLGAAACGGERCSCSASPNPSTFDSSRESDSGLESHFDSQN
uniref:C2 domain-containing protein n=1 Tax=Ditylenchus dipsaci TaxID=166011 RepID=A0A915D013_9BILA